MEALLQSLAMKYGMEKAIQLLGIDKQTQNPKYAISMGGQNLNLGNMGKRALLNRGVSAITGSGSGSGGGILSTLGPLALGAGAIYFLNKNREKLTGYKTQQAYENARDQRRADNRLDKITDRMTSGKNYGNYEEALLNSGAGAVEIDGTIYSGPDYQGGNDNSGDHDGGASADAQSDDAAGAGGYKRGGRTRYGRGGIASL